MSYNNCILILIITTVFLVNNIPIAFSIENDTELHYTCGTSCEQPFNDIYRESRALVMIDLIYNIQSYQGFRSASHAFPTNISGSEMAYGLALCRADVAPDDCKKCVITLINTTRHHCPESRSGIIWRQLCFVKYSDVDFLGIIDTLNMFSFWRPSSSAMFPDFTDAATNLTGSLTETAVASPMFYAHDQFQVMDTGYGPFTLYGVAQCTRDISTDDCKSCLDSAVTQLATGSSGAGVFYGSCNLRYEIFNFSTS
ncbi:hypothetical protein CASFOL_000924 [Castilleja foliolosa]|uniref:Gnk2-homologous domain-containing protein n=1 Tax=Castilleja foliolosa TaxID=1961234 RepID=A0ABD3EL45_9LAMI